MSILPPYSRRKDARAAKQFKVFGFGRFFKSVQEDFGLLPKASKIKKENKKAVCNTANRSKSIENKITLFQP